MRQKVINADAAPTQAETNAGVARASGVLALGNVASRVLGLVRETVLANQFGASASVDAFNIALIIPRTIHDLLIAGHVNSAIVPVLSEAAATQGKKAFWQLVSVLLTLVTLIITALVVVMQVFAPQLVGLLGGGSDAETQRLAVDLLRLTSPALLFLALFSLAAVSRFASGSAAVTARTVDRETLERTTLGRRTVGDLVNIETDILARHVARLARLDGRIRA